MNDSKFPRVLTRTAFSLRANLEERFHTQGYPLTMPQWVLLHVLRHRDSIPQKEVARRAFKDKTNVARIPASLEDSGLVICRKDPQDQRSYQVSLTKKGRQLETALQQSMTWVMDQATAGIPRRDLKITLRTLQQLLQHLSLE